MAISWPNTRLTPILYVLDRPPRRYYPFASSILSTVPFTSSTISPIQEMIQPNTMVLVYSSIARYSPRTTFIMPKLASTALVNVFCLLGKWHCPVQTLRQLLCRRLQGYAGHLVRSIRFKHADCATSRFENDPGVPAVSIKPINICFESSGKVCRCPKPQPPPHRIFRTSFPTAPQICVAFSSETATAVQQEHRK